MGFSIISKNIISQSNVIVSLLINELHSAQSTVNEDDSNKFRYYDNFNSITAIKESWFDLCV